ncbi:MAG: hypothetical protein QM741_17370 [Rudaea sp.]|uniref:hypothetical protein n=1 Tax=Rudaea sp. TaxID=2136325 RepID=UPI0039E385B9
MTFLAIRHGGQEARSHSKIGEVIPGGNSAVLGSPNYVDQLPLWLTGQNTIR